MKGAGHLGAERVTVQNLDRRQGGRGKQSDRCAGAVPGPRGGIVVLSDSVKKA